MPQPFAIDERLSADELGELRRWMRERRRTVDDVHDWAQARGYIIARSAVGGWVAKERAEQAAEAMRQSSAVGRALIDAAKEEGSVGVQDALVLMLANAAVETLTEAQSQGVARPEDIESLSLSVQRLAYSKRNIEAVRAKIREEVRAEQAAALAKAEASVPKDASAADVFREARKLLGIGDNPPPEAAVPPHAAGIAGTRPAEDAGTSARGGAA